MFFNISIYFNEITATRSSTLVEIKFNNLRVDETLLSYKGRLSFKQYSATAKMDMY